MQCSDTVCCALQLLLCPLSQAGQSAIIDAVWTEVLHQLLDLVASADLQDKVLYTQWSCNVVTEHMPPHTVFVQYDVYLITGRMVCSDEGCCKGSY